MSCNLLPELMSNPDPEVSGRVMEALLKMKKLDIAALELAAKVALTGQGKR